MIWNRRENMKYQWLRNAEKEMYQERNLAAKTAWREVYLQENSEANRSMLITSRNRQLREYRFICPRHLGVLTRRHVKRNSKNLEELEELRQKKYQKQSRRRKRERKASDILEPLSESRRRIWPLWKKMKKTPLPNRRRRKAIYLRYREISLKNEEKIISCRNMKAAQEEKKSGGVKEEEKRSAERKYSLWREMKRSWNACQLEEESEERREEIWRSLKSTWNDSKMKMPSESGARRRSSAKTLRARLRYLQLTCGFWKYLKKAGWKRRPSTRSSYRSWNGWLKITWLGRERRSLSLISICLFETPKRPEETLASALLLANSKYQLFLKEEKYHGRENFSSWRNWKKLLRRLWRKKRKQEIRRKAIFRRSIRQHIYIWAVKKYLS